MGSGPAGIRARTGAWPLAAILVLALGVRVAWLVTRIQVVENEGGDYAAIAEHLLAGDGYVGLGITGKPQLLFPPLYAFGIAGLTSVLGDSELSGRLVSLAAGLLLVVALYRLAHWLYGGRAAWIAGLLAALHPLLISLSVSVYTESTYFALVFFGILASVKAMEAGRLRDYALAGALYGAAYLTRPEALLYLGVLTLVAAAKALATVSERGPAFRGLAAAFVVFALFAAPYVGYLHKHTGRLMLEGKTASNFVIGQHMREGQNEWYAYYGVDEELREVGAYMGDVNRHLRTVVPRPSIPELVSYVSASARRHGRIMLGALKSHAFGGVLFFLLALTGFGYGWLKASRWPQAFLTLATAAVIGATFSLQFYYVRYSYVLLPLVLLWAAAGTAWLSGRAATLAVTGRAPASASEPRLAAAVGLMLVLGVVGVAGTAEVHAAFDEFGNTKAGAAFTRQAGLWLRDRPPDRKVVMDVGTAIPYYARGEFVALPYASSETARRYIDLKRPDYVVLRGVLASHRPYLEDWLAHGVPGDHLRLVYEVGKSGPERIKIFEWRGDGKGPG